MTRFNRGVSADATPKSAGFRMPAEWAAHDKSWIMWPCREEIWPNLDATKRAYAAVARAIRQFEPVTVAVRPKDAEEARRMLDAAVDVIEVAIDDSWARDAGPCFLLNDEHDLAGVSFRFNAWGDKYRPYDDDDAFAHWVLAHEGGRAFSSELVAEGGGISVDGEGTVLTTESCFPNANRNPDWSRDAIEAEMKNMLGAEKVIWLPGDREETETDGHVDGIAVFVKPGVVLIEDAGAPGDPFHEIMLANIEAMRGQTDAKGRPIELVRIGEAIDADADSDRFCRSYVNFYFVNGGLIMPSYGIPADRTGHDMFAALFPDRRIVQVRIDDIAIGGGGVHCITQQQPASAGHVRRKSA